MGSDGGLHAGTVLPGSVTLLDQVPQAHKVMLVDLPPCKAIPSRATAMPMDGGHTQRAVHHHQGAVCGGCAGPGGGAHPQPTVATFPLVDGVVGLERSYGCGVAIDAPDTPFPTRTLQLAAGMNLRVFTTGRKRTWAEHWKMHHAPVLFNPAPGT